MSFSPLNAYVKNHYGTRDDDGDDDGNDVLHPLSPAPTHFSASIFQSRLVSS